MHLVGKKCCKKINTSTKFPYFTRTKHPPGERQGVAPSVKVRRQPPPEQKMPSRRTAKGSLTKKKAKLPLPPFTGGPSRAKKTLSLREARGPPAKILDLPRSHFCKRPPPGQKTLSGRTARGAYCIFYLPLVGGH